MHSYAKKDNSVRPILLMSSFFCELFSHQLNVTTPIFYTSKRFSAQPSYIALKRTTKYSAEPAQTSEGFD